MTAIPNLLLPLRLKQRSILPGFGLTMGYTMLYLSLLVIIPLFGLFYKSAALSWPKFSQAITQPDVLYSLKLTFGLSLLAACINVVFGFVAAWTLVRYSFPGKRLFDAIIDLPFALPTAVSGITLATLYSSNGWLGKPWEWLATLINNLLDFTRISALLAWLGMPENFQHLPNQIAYTKLGMLIALIFIGVPFMIRTLQPALEDMDPEYEEAAASLGASRWQTFRHVVIPTLLPAIFTGFSLSFARAVGEYGSVIFISSNKPGESQITAHLIWQKLEQQNSAPGSADMAMATATSLGIIMLVVSFGILILVNSLQWWASKRSQAEGA